MYESFCGLREPAFELTANPAYLFLTAHHREALVNLQYGLSAAKPITLLIGEAGTGKSTLLRAAMASDMCRHVTCLYLENPTLTRAEFFEVLATRLGLDPDPERSKASVLVELESMARERQARQEVIALVIDEAQALPDEILEEIRLLANIETPSSKLVPVVLAGQIEFAERLNDPRLRQLKQRIALRCELRRLDLAETAAYISSRIRTAGGNPAKLFTREAVTLIHEHSDGVPRTISVICDNALMSGFALHRRPIDGGIVREVCRDFDLRRADADSPSTSPLSPAAAPPPESRGPRSIFGLHSAAAPLPAAAADAAREPRTGRALR